MPFKLGGWELILILAIVLVIFGAGKLPEIGGAMGKAIKEFRKSSTAPGEPQEPKQAKARRTSTKSKETAAKEK